MNTKLALAMMNTMGAFHAPAFNTDLNPGGGGGGTASIAPPAGGGGVFSGITAPVSAAPAAPAPGAGAAPTPGQPPAGAQPGPTGQPAADPALTPFHAPIMGRFKTWKEADEGFRRSQDEGLRLHTELKTWREKYEKDVQEREEKIARFQAELEQAKTATPFKVLTEAEEEALAKEQPGKLAQYLVKKELHQRDEASRKEATERQIQQQKERRENINRTIDQRDLEMSGDPANYPQYEAMKPIARQFIDRTRDESGYSPLTGHAYTPEVLYLISLGWSHQQTLKKGGQVTGDAAEQAKRQAEAAAAAGRGAGGAGSGAGLPGGGQTPEQENQAWKDAVLKAAPKRFFGK